MNEPWIKLLFLLIQFYVYYTMYNQVSVDMYDTLFVVFGGVVMTRRVVIIFIIARKVSAAFGSMSKDHDDNPEILIYQYKKLFVSLKVVVLLPFVRSRNVLKIQRFLLHLVHLPKLTRFPVNQYGM